MNSYLKQFFQLQKDVEALSYVDAVILYKLLFDWAKTLKDSKNELEIAMYDVYIYYFEKVPADAISIKAPWYRFDELVEFDFLRSKPMDLERAVVVVRDILWEMAAVKSIRNCVNPDASFLRILKGQTQGLLFGCDNCSYKEDLRGNRVISNEVLYPMPFAEINVSSLPVLGV